MMSVGEIEEMVDAFSYGQIASLIGVGAPSPAILKRCEMKMNTYLTERNPIIALAAFGDLKSICRDNNISFSEHDQKIVRDQREYVFGRED